MSVSCSRRFSGRFRSSLWSYSRANAMNSDHGFHYIPSFRFRSSSGDSFGFYTRYNS